MKKLSDERDVTLDTVTVDLIGYDLGKEKYELITDLYFYEKALLPSVVACLKSSGIFIFEQFTCDHRKYGQFGPKNSAYLVHPDGLLEIFKRFRIFYTARTQSANSTKECTKEPRPSSD